MTSFNKTEAVIFPMQAMLHVGFSLFSDELNTNDNFSAFFKWQK